MPIAGKTAEQMFVSSSGVSWIHSTQPRPKVAQLVLRSRAAWPHKFDAARHHGDDPGASGNPDGLSQRCA